MDLNRIQTIVNVFQGDFGRASHAIYMSANNLQQQLTDALIRRERRREAQAIIEAVPYEQTTDEEIHDMLTDNLPSYGIELCCACLEETDVYFCENGHAMLCYQCSVEMYKRQEEKHYFRCPCCRYENVLKYYDSDE